MACQPVFTRSINAIPNTMSVYLTLPINMKKLLTTLMIFSSLNSFSQEKSELQKFWNRLETLCGKSFPGRLIVPENDAQFGGKTLIMHVRSCQENSIRIPFIVGEDRSRTWVLTKKENRLELKHDHRHHDGSPDKVSMYGGISSNEGKSNVQVFPADQQTANLIPAAASNVWWITLNDSVFTYNLSRVDTSRIFKIEFDLRKSIENPEAPWGWNE